VARTWDEAFRADRPVVVEAVTDPEVPPLPPHITLAQAKALSSAILAGDPGARGIIRQAYRDMIESWIPHRG
jgi:pyruvate dehydrogenase (quinone)